MAENDSSPRFRFPDWQAEYQAALLEFDRNKLLERIATAESAISNRLRTVFQGAEHEAERQAIQDALLRLSALKQENLRDRDVGST